MGDVWLWSIGMTKCRKPQSNTCIGEGSRPPSNWTERDIITNN